MKWLRRSQHPGAVCALFAASGVLWASAGEAHTAFSKFYDHYRYEASGADLGSAWRNPGYDDSAWPIGETPLGQAAQSYGVNFRTEIPASQQTTYLRRRFQVDVTPGSVTSLSFNVAYAHGFVAYLNGTEIVRRSLPATGPITFNTPAQQHIPTGFESVPIPGAENNLVSGENVLAVELHQTSPVTDILVWAAELEFTTSEAHVTRGPYLQQGTPTSTIVRWRTSVPTDSVLRYGSQAGHA